MSSKLPAGQHLGELAPIYKHFVFVSAVLLILVDSDKIIDFYNLNVPQPVSRGKHVLFRKSFDLVELLESRSMVFCEIEGTG